MSNREYSPALDVTAGELREAGYSVPDNIPDCAWIPQSSVKESYDPATDSDIRLTFTEPFRWNELNPGAAPGSPDRVLKREEAVP